MKCFVYILQCADNTYYCGYTVDLKRRLLQHNSAVASKYTRSRLPVKLVYYEEYIDRGQALSREYVIKQLSRPAKIRLIEGFNADNLIEFS